MAHHSAPPIVIDGYDHPHAFTNIPLATRPEWGSCQCGECDGHGRRNAVLFLDSFRTTIAACGRCDGSGWLSSDGARHLQDIVLIDGRPAWTVRIQHPATLSCLVVPRRAEPVERAEDEYAEGLRAA